MKGNNDKKITLPEVHTKLKRNSKARKSQEAMKAYRWDFLFKLDWLLLIKYTYINKEKHAIEKFTSE